MSRSANARALDQRVIEGLGLPGIALMELASAGAAQLIREAHQGGEILVLCGPGNNGGDGWGIARWLRGWGLPVRVWCTTNSPPGDAGIMAAAALAAGVPMSRTLGCPELVVDALFGTGLTRAVSGVAAEALEALRGTRTIAVDLPSGLCGDTGALLGPVLEAETTVTFGRAKVGMYVGDGPGVCGQVQVVDIGLGAGAQPDDLADAFMVEATDMQWPRRPLANHKHQNGHLLVVAGSAQMAGAAVLCCRGALAAGVGLVSLVAPRGAWSRLGALPPEVMVRDGGEGDRLERAPPLSGVTAVVVGPGLGGGRPLPVRLLEDLRLWWTQGAPPMVFDADALICTSRTSRRDRVLTPHEGEAGRLLGTTGVRFDRLETVQAMADRGVALLKGPHTLVCDGDSTTINPTGGPVLATGGSGDVLAGLIGGLVARGLSGVDAARLGAFVHGRAGDLLQATEQDGWTASDIATALRQAAISAGT